MEIPKNIFNYIVLHEYQICTIFTYTATGINSLT